MFVFVCCLKLLNRWTLTQTNAVLYMYTVYITNIVYIYVCLYNKIHRHHACITNSWIPPNNHNCHKQNVGVHHHLQTRNKTKWSQVTSMYLNQWSPKNTSLRRQKTNEKMRSKFLHQVAEKMRSNKVPWEATETPLGKRRKITWFCGHGRLGEGEQKHLPFSKQGGQTSLSRLQ